MTEAISKINNKSVQLSLPYVAPASPMVAREAEMRKILAAWMGGDDGIPLAPLLLGEPGQGKNRIVYECARMCGKDLYIHQGHEDVSAEDLICLLRISDDPGKKMDYILPAVSTAMIEGGVCFVDEIAKIRRRALAPLASLLEERRYLDSTLLGERIHAHPGFRFIAATNTDDLKGNLLPDFIRSRMRPIIRVGYPDRNEIDAIVVARFPARRPELHDLMNHCWKLWRAKMGKTPPTPRDMLHLFGYGIKLADFEAAEAMRPLNLQSPAAGFSKLKKEHLELAFEAVFDAAERSAA